MQGPDFGISIVTMPEIFTIRIRKEALKFASSHMTVFPDGSKEALHGHHYVPTVSVSHEVIVPGTKRFKKMIPFSEIKAAMKKICARWDEKVLLAENNPYFKNLKTTKKLIHFSVCDKEYMLPLDEVELLPVANITCEELAKLYSELLFKALPLLSEKPVLTVTVDIEESPGQGASYTVQVAGKSK